jgi:putative flippase GtrA
LIARRLATAAKGLSRRRLLRFLTVGVAANVLLFVLTYALLSIGAPTFLAGGLGYAVAFAAAYLAQERWTFAGSHSPGSTLPRYIVAQLACAAASGLVGQICAAIFAMTPLATSLAVTATAGAMSYLLSSRWVFRERAPSACPRPPVPIGQRR